MTVPQINKADTLVFYACNLAIPRTGAAAIGGAVPRLSNTAKTVMVCEVDSIPARPDNTASNNGQDASLATFGLGPAYSAATQGIGLYPFPGGGSGGSFETGCMGGHAFAGRRGPVLCDSQ